MDVVLVNQFRMVVDRNEIDGEIGKVFRTKKTLDELKANIKEDRDNINNLVVDDAEWFSEGQVVVTLANIGNTNSIDAARTFNKHARTKPCKYHTMQEILESGLAYVKGFGILDIEKSREEFEDKFKEVAENL